MVRRLPMPSGSRWASLSHDTLHRVGGDRREAEHREAGTMIDIMIAAATMAALALIAVALERGERAR